MFTVHVKSSTIHSATETEAFNTDYFDTTSHWSTYFKQRLQIQTETTCTTRIQTSVAFRAFACYSLKDLHSQLLSSSKAQSVLCYRDFKFI